MNNRINIKSKQWWICSLKWSFHNWIIHPLSDLLYWLAVLVQFIPPARDNLLKASDWIHDNSTPAEAKTIEEAK